MKKNVIIYLADIQDTIFNAQIVTTNTQNMEFFE